MVTMLLPKPALLQRYKIMVYAIIDAVSDVEELITVAYGDRAYELARWFIDEVKDTADMYLSAQEDFDTVDKACEDLEVLCEDEDSSEVADIDGITVEAIDEKFSLLAGACRSSANRIEKLVNNIAEYKESEGVLEYSATPFEGKEHVTAAYLCEIGSEKWADEGITKEMIKEHAFDLLYTCQDKDQMKYLVIEAELSPERPATFPTRVPRNK